VLAVWVGAEQKGHRGTEQRRDFQTIRTEDDAVARLSCTWYAIKRWRRELARVSARHARHVLYLTIEDREANRRPRHLPTARVLAPNPDRGPRDCWEPMTFRLVGNLRRRRCRARRVAFCLNRYSPKGATVVVEDQFRADIVHKSDVGGGSFSISPIPMRSETAADGKSWRGAESGRRPEARNIRA